MLRGQLQTSSIKRQFYVISPVSTWLGAYLVPLKRGHCLYRKVNLDIHVKGPVAAKGVQSPLLGVRGFRAHLLYMLKCSK